jgi:acylphosphatase
LSFGFWVSNFPVRAQVFAGTRNATELSSRSLMSDVHHETVFFSGHVQGVGFRYSVLQVAKEFEIAGFVSNLLDGRVQLEAEGTAEEVAAFVDAVQEKMHGYIRKVERNGETRPATFRGFTIK